MKFGISLPNFGKTFGDIHKLVDVAKDAEAAGWDGFFLWDHLLVFKEDVTTFVDPYIALAAIACNTQRMKIGPMITPLPRRRPWKVAREAVTLDHLSGGRLIMGVGIGAPPEIEFEAFGENGNARVRADRLDESLSIIQGLWSGESFTHKGKYYQLDDITFLPRPKQEEGIPIWVGGGMPHKRPFRRAARYNGVIPVHSEWPKPVTVELLRDILDIIRSERDNLQDYDVVICGETTGDDSDADSQTVSPWREVGVTWWLEDIHGYRAGIEVLRERIRLGPPDV